MFVDEVSHLGHILTYNLNDKQDIIRVAKDMNLKANSILCKFSALDSAIKCYLIKSYCLSLYGSALWSLGSPSIKIIEISLNKILRKVWNLPRMSHTRIVHCIAGSYSLNIVPCIQSFLLLFFICFIILLPTTLIYLCQLCTAGIFTYGI